METAVTPRSVKARKKRWRFSVPLVFAGILLTVLLYSVFVYVVPTLSEQDTSEAFDAFTYAKILDDDPANARELQPFLGAYPAGISTSALPLYAFGLHALLLVVPFYFIRRTLGKEGLLVALAAFAVPESAIFLGAVSKEGMGIVAVAAALAGQALYFQNRPRWAFLITTYGILVAEYSRQHFGFVFAVAVLVGYFPTLSRRNQRRAIWFAVAAMVTGVWTILYGPLKAEFTEAYQTARTFLFWFEENMASDSAAKGAIRTVFSLAFGSEEPGLFNMAIVVFAAIGKGLVYLLAVPLISPTAFSNMPAQTWALTWQVATSASTAAIIFGLYKIRRSKLKLSLEERCRFYLGFSLLFLIAISTAIFHVRYRAPAVIVILFAIWMARGKGKELLFPMSVAAISTACYAILTT